MDAIKSIARWSGEDSGYDVGVYMAADHKVDHYLISFDSKAGLLSFHPGHSVSGRLPGLTRDLGFDELKDAGQRAICTDAVNKLNEHLNLVLGGDPGIQSYHGNWLVSYHTVSEVEDRSTHRKYTNPYVSFLVTPGGTVIAVYWGT